LNTNTASLINSLTLNNPYSSQPSPAYTTASAFTSGSGQQFRVSAYNGVGQGPYSTTQTCTALSFPTGTVTLSEGAITPTSVTFSWSALTTGTGGSTIIFYAVEYSSTSSSSGFSQLNALSSGIVTSYTHSPGPVFPSGASLYYRVRAVNNVGYSLSYSSVLTVTADSEPVS
jgi:hypothetical protein